MFCILLSVSQTGGDHCNRDGNMPLRNRERLLVAVFSCLPFAARRTLMGSRRDLKNSFSESAVSPRCGCNRQASDSAPILAPSFSVRSNFLTKRVIADHTALDVTSNVTFSIAQYS